MTNSKERTVVARASSAPRIDSGYPSLTEEALGQLKLAWRLAHEVDDRGALSVGICRGSAAAIGSPTTFRITQLVSTDCEVTLDGAAFSDWSAGDAGEIAIRTTVDDHHFMVRCR